MSVLIHAYYVESDTIAHLQQCSAFKVYEAKMRLGTIFHATRLLVTRRFDEEMKTARLVDVYSC